MKDVFCLISKLAKGLVMNTTVKFLVLGLFAGVLAACSSTGVKEDSGAVDNVTWTAAEAVSIDNENASIAESVISQDLEADLTSVFYFEFDKSSLTSETRSDLDAYAEALVASPRNIRLEGHADERGSREYNIALGERRAKSVADYLIASGVSAGRIETISYGEERPAVSGTNSAAWAENRRVELK